MEKMCKNRLAILMSTCRIGAFVLMACLLVAGPVAKAQDTAASRDALVKAAMVYNFIRFIEWPDDAPSTRVVCTYQGSNLSPAMMSISGKPVGPSIIAIRELNSTDGLESCDVFVVSKTDGLVFEEEGETLVNSAILTVGDEPGFAGRGGIIGFTQRDGRIGFQVNTDQAEARGLKFSSRLLRLAEIVSTDGAR